MASQVLSPRRRPRQARSRATHDALLEAAAQIISRHGLAGFTTNAVADRAGVSIGSLYQYFPNKDALMVALIERTQQRQQAELRSAMEAAPSGDFAAIVRFVVRAGMQHHLDDSLLASAIDHEEARLPVGAVVEVTLSSTGTWIDALLRRHLPELPAAVRDRAIHTLPVLVRAVVDRWANLSPPQLDVAEDEAVRAVLGYLRGDN